MMIPCPLVLASQIAGSQNQAVEIPFLDIFILTYFAQDGLKFLGSKSPSSEYKFAGGPSADGSGWDTLTPNCLQNLGYGQCSALAGSFKTKF